MKDGLCYVIASWTGTRRGRDRRYESDPLIYAREHLRRLKLLPHSIDKIVVYFPFMKDEPAHITRAIDEMGAHADPLVDIRRRENRGQSYGSYHDAYEAYRKDGYKWWFFVEDDYVATQDNFDQVFLDIFQSEPRCSMSTPLNIGAEVPKFGYVEHPGAGIGFTSSAILDRIWARNGGFNHEAGDVDYNIADQILWGIVFGEQGKILDTRGKYCFAYRAGRAGTRIYHDPRLPLIFAPQQDPDLLANHELRFGFGMFHIPLPPAPASDRASPMLLAKPQTEVRLPPLLLRTFLSRLLRLSRPEAPSEPQPAQAKHTRFEFGRAHRETLAPALMDLVTWRAAPSPQRPAGPLFSMWSKLSHGQKWHHYFPIYERTFAPLRARPIKVMEIGVHRGASLKLWREYFHADTQIVGVDIDPRCRECEDAGRSVHVRIGSQADQPFLQTVVEEFGPFDLIIDDGSHVASHMLASFNYLFLEGLNDDGIYFVEDMHSNYFQAFRDTEFSFMDMAKSLVDVMHAHYIEDATHPSKVRAFILDDEKRLPALDVPRVTTLLDEIRFHDSIVIFYRKPRHALPVSHIAKD